MTPDDTPPPKLLDQVRDRLRVKHYSLRTEAQYLQWIRRFIRFHSTGHPGELGAPAVEAFLTHLAVEERVAASTRNQALSALLFLYREVLAVTLPWLDALARAKPSPALPLVLSPREVEAVLAQCIGVHGLMLRLLYGTGMRLMECVRLRVKDVDFERGEIVVRDGAGARDRVTLLPRCLVAPLQAHLQDRRALFEQDVAAGRGAVALPDALAREFNGAEGAWDWQFVFPATGYAVDSRSGAEGRPPLDEKALQRAMKRAVLAAGIAKPATPHTLRHSFATHLLQAGYDVRTVQALMGHKALAATLIYTQLLKQGGEGVVSPLDALLAG